MRSVLQDESDALRFDKEVDAEGWGERYQQAADFLVRNRDQDVLNRIIRLAVLGACESVTQHERRLLLNDEKQLRQLELDGAWALDPGVAAFGELIAGMPADVRGPVITTNFDPLIEVSIKRAGGSPNLQLFDTDGKLVATEDPGAIDVAHVHGFWRRGDTLHTVHHLTAPRPQLDGSLREILRGHVVIVMGYSGWADAFSRSLRARALEGQSLGIDVLWCSFHALSPADFEQGLFAELSASSRSVFYGPVDLNHFLPTVLQEVTASGLTKTGDQVDLAGWTRVTTSYLEARAGARDDVSGHRALFFDGLEPDWGTVADTAIPRLSFAQELSSALNRDTTAKPTPFVVGVGLTGSGKSLALRQCIAGVVHRGEGQLALWREPGSRLHVNQVLALPRVTGRRYLLATDDADLLIDDLRHLAAELAKRGRDDIRVVGVAQERDWRNAGGFNRLSAATTLVKVPELSTPDAIAVVGAWESLGAQGLGKLSGVDSQERVDALEAVAHDRSSDAPASLLGAMLALRYGDQLVDRVGDLLGRLDNFGSVGDSSLTDSFLMIALMHAHGRSPARGATAATARLLAEACNIDEIAVDYLVLEPLGKEAAISHHSANVWVRHEAIARATLDASRARDDAEIPRVLKALVAAAMRLSPTTGRQADDLYAAAYIARHLTLKTEALAAAETAAALQPQRLTYATSLITAYRTHDLVQEALETAERAWSARTSMVDLHESEDGLLTAWATACGAAQDPVGNVLLDARCLANHLSEPAHEASTRALLGMGVGLTTLHKQTGDVVFAQALGAVVTLLMQASLIGKQAGWLATHKRTCAGAGVIYPVEDPLTAIGRALQRLAPLREGLVGPLKTMPVSLGSIASDDA